MILLSSMLKSYNLCLYLSPLKCQGQRPPPTHSGQFRGCGQHNWASTYATFSGRENHKTVAVVCSACNGSFSSQEFLAKHKCFVQTEPGCQLCPKTSSSSRGLTVHIKRKHTVATRSSAARLVKGERVPCEEPGCIKTFSQASL